MDIKRNRKIPDPAINFHATGLSGLQKQEINLLRQILKPVSQYFDCSLSKYSPHISCRYLGYKDEVSFKKIKEITPLLKEIYKRFLPVKCVVGNLFAGWEHNPNYRPRLLMIEVQSSELKLLHEEILKKTKTFPIFSGVEGKNFTPHFTLGSLKKEFEDEIPKAVSDFVMNAEVKRFKTYLRTAYVHVEKGMGFQKIMRTRE